MRRKITYDPQRDYYELLGISTGATPEDIRRAYRRRVREVHPDVNPDRHAWATAQIQLVNEAYDVLRQPEARREYDRLRWPHVPHTPRASGDTYRSPFQASSYDPARPWWEQASPQADRSPYSGARRRRSRRTTTKETPPFWLAVGAWLREHHLGALEPTWLTLVGLWRSPYAGILTVLGVVLALNVAVIVYAFIGPGDGDLLAEARDWFGLEAANTPHPLLPLSGATPDRLHQTCPDPDIQIYQPVANELVGDTFSVYGTVDHPDMWHYTLALGYLGQGLPLARVPDSWSEVRAPPPNQSVPERAVTGDMLTDSAHPVDMRGRPPGFYAVRLKVVLVNGTVLPPCDVIVRR